jgi:outer membrane protein assembly factor BamA
MKSLVLVLMLASALGFAQTAPARKSPGKTRAKAAAQAEPASRWPIGSLAVEGNRNYTSEQVLRVAGLKVGQLAGKEEFDAASDRLEASGVFDKVGYKFGPASDGKSYAASFQVVEAGPALPVRFNRLGVPDADLEGVLRSRDPFFTAGKAPATRIVVDRYTKWIAEYLTSKGLESKVVTDVTTRPEGMCLVFESASALPAVAQVSFEGNQAIPQNTLREAVAGPAVGSAYTEERFRAILDNAVRPLYEARGLIRVAFPKIATERAKEVEGLNVTVTVAEGEVYKFGKVEIAGQSPVAPADLLKAANLPSGETANFDRVGEALESVRKAVSRAGYLDAQVTPERKVNDAGKTVAVALRIEPGPQYLMGGLTVAGLDLSGEAEIRRMWALKEGKPFNALYPDSFLASVKAGGIFDNLAEARAQVKKNERAHTADVTLTFGGGKKEESQPRRRSVF